MKDPVKNRVRQKNYRKQHPEKIRELKRHYMRKRLYGVCREEYERRLVEQDYRCAICRGLPGKFSLSVDHDHTTNAVRQLLCNNCNRGLGAFKDNTALLQAAIEYLRRHVKYE